MGVVAYADLVRAVREAVRHHTARDATILVISRGDERLLNLYGRRAWHFPRTAQGYFAGEHPGDLGEILSLRLLRLLAGRRRRIPPPAIDSFLVARPLLGPVRRADSSSSPS